MDHRTFSISIILALSMGCSVFFSEDAPSNRPPCTGAACEGDDADAGNDGGGGDGGAANNGAANNGAANNGSNDGDSDGSNNGEELPCESAEDCPPATTCERWHCEASICRSEAADATEPCDDENPCTVEDHCNGAGSCVGTPRTCTTPPADLCEGNTWVHFASLGRCEIKDTDQAGCVYDRTEAACPSCESECLGRCTPGACPGSADGCMQGVCTPSGVGMEVTCSMTTAPDRTPCPINDQNGAGTGVCLAGRCVACTQSSDCTQGQERLCNPQHACVECLEDRDCGGSYGCVHNTCDDGVCNRYIQPDHERCYLADQRMRFCSESQCVECDENTPCPDATPVCSGTGTCVQCVSGRQDACIDGNPCTADVCSGTECVNPVWPSLNGTACEGDGTCNNGVCRH